VHVSYLLIYVAYSGKSPELPTLSLPNPNTTLGSLDRSHGCMGQTVPDLWRQANHWYVMLLFEILDMLFCFKISAAQRWERSTIETQFCTFWLREKLGKDGWDVWLKFCVWPRTKPDLWYWYTVWWVAPAWSGEQRSSRK